MSTETATEMTDEEIDRLEMVRLLRRGHDEIVGLRRANAALAPKADAYDTLAIFARLSSPPEQRGMGVDVAWEIEKAVERLTTKTPQA